MQISLNQKNVIISGGESRRSSALNRIDDVMKDHDILGPGSFEK